LPPWLHQRLEAEGIRRGRRCDVREPH
jgi:hypothetical protein